MREEAEKEKRFVRGLRPDIKSKLVPFQLRVYHHPVEKALEVELDIQESRGGNSRDMFFSKRPRYQEISRVGISDLKIKRNMGILHSISPKKY